MEIDKRDFIAMNNNSSKVAIERDSSFLMNCYAKTCKDENQSTKEEFIKYYKVAIERDSSFLMNCYAKIFKDENQSTKEEFIKYYKEAIDKAYKLALMLQNGDGINTYK